ncbi:hypothetical protein H312_00500 [Anncaliia algerae PRA339]|uniref:Uncharacterized protein n=1 Tax=Anncaliia algerae PRA339 TaxID=1288291 RepID=A0A059F423_9MICR|nr:hypothetical protein H312_00500 [Anncaliia algerae PRA339]
MIKTNNRIFIILLLLNEIITTAYIIPTDHLSSGSFHTTVNYVNGADFFNSDPYFYNHSFKFFMPYSPLLSQQYIQSMYCVNLNAMNVAIDIPKNSNILESYLDAIIRHNKQVSDSKLFLDKEAMDFLFCPESCKADDLIILPKNILPVVKCFTLEMFKEKYELFLRNNQPYLRYPSPSSMRTIVDCIFLHFEDNVHDIMMFSIFYISITDGFNHIIDPQTKNIYLKANNKYFVAFKESVDLLQLIDSWKHSRICLNSVYEAYILLVGRFYKCYFKSFNNLDDFRIVLNAFKWCAYNSLYKFFY